jgi:hypothetical protein
LARLLRATGALLLVAAFVAGARYAPLFERQAPSALDRPLAAELHRPAPRRVLLVSVDGLAPRVLDASEAPFLSRLAREGTRARAAETVVPSITMTAHATLLSGLSPSEHGVSWNRYQPWSRVRVPTVFAFCAEAHLRCGLFAGKSKLAHFAEDEPGVERFRRGSETEQVLALAAEYLRERDPDLVVVHLAEVDLVGHAEGWGSDAQIREIGRVDAALARFLPVVREASPRPFALLLTADHGGRGRGHGSGHPDDVAVPWLLYGDGIPAGLELARAHALDAAPTLLSLLGLEPPAEWAGVAHFPLEPR